MELGIVRELLFLTYIFHMPCSLGAQFDVIQVNCNVNYFKIISTKKTIRCL